MKARNSGPISDDWRPTLSKPSQAAGSRPEGVILMVHGGAPESVRQVDSCYGGYLRMWLMRRAVAHEAATHEIDIWLLKNRVRGWNSASLPSLDDARWGLQQLQDRYSDVPVVLVGHSMGGRTTIHLANEAGVEGVVALAPWLPAGEPIGGIAGTPLAIIHGSQDRWTPPGESLAFAERLRAAGSSVARSVIPGVGHFMLQRIPTWNQATIEAALALFGIGPFGERLSDQFAAAGDAGLRRPL